MRFFLKSISLVTYFACFLAADLIPTNNLNNYSLNRWVVVKDDGLNNDKIKELINDPLLFTENSIEKFNIDLGEQKDVAIQAYQLFENFSFKLNVMLVSVTN